MPTGRYAPSPTGTFHIGNLRTAVAAWLFTRPDDSDLLLRWEDLDTTASAVHEAAQRADFERLGLRFDGLELRQTDRIEAYREVLADLSRRDLTYPCWCSRKDIRDAPAAPHGPPGSYPGTCRDLSRTEIADRERGGRPPATRLRTDHPHVTIVDRLHGEHSEIVDDFVLERFDGTPAYNLVVVVDDHVQGVGQVVRADDLLASTPRHAHLHHVLGQPEPEWIHVPLVHDANGDRLAKRDGSAGLALWLANGRTVESLLAQIGRSLGIALSDAADLGELAAGFDPTAVTTEPAVYDQATATLSLAD
ncbi:MAG: tRNA glutamyl-Q(34) synthetase GluQRS [Acidimicrobiales bacterium]|nr:tRNA glutamyl-Q(34) synthetase GluQRS [Acidimicrobiales bacterium]